MPITSSSKLPEVVSILNEIGDWQSFLATVSQGMQAVVLDSQTDALEQIASHLLGAPPPKAIQIVRHGAPGELKRGLATLNQGSLAQYEPTVIGTWPSVHTAGPQKAAWLVGIASRGRFV